MAAVSKSILVAAALLLVGFGAAGAVWADEWRNTMGDYDPPRPYIKKQTVQIIDVKPGVVKSTLSPAGFPKGSSARLKPTLPTLPAKPAKLKQLQGPKSVTQNSKVDAKAVRVRRPRFHHALGYKPGFTEPFTFGYPGSVSYVGDFWHGMYRAARASTIAK